MGLACSSFLAEGACCAGCMACSCLRKMIPRAKGMRPLRLSHLALCTVFLAAAFWLGSPGLISYLYKLSDSGILGVLGWRNRFKPQVGCLDEYLDDCIQHQVMYRGTLTIVLLNMLVGSTVWATSLLYSRLNSIKALFVVLTFCSLLLTHNRTIDHWVTLTRYLSLPWLVLQGFLLLDVAHELHTFLLRKAEEQEERSGMSAQAGPLGSWWRILYVALSLGGLLAAIWGAIAMSQEGYTACSGLLGPLVVHSTWVLGAVGVVVSLLSSVCVGLLVPSLAWAYSTFLSRMALSTDETCALLTSETGMIDHPVVFHIALGLLVFLSLWCAWQGERMLALFDRGSSSSSSSGSSGSRDGFELLVGGGGGGGGGYNTMSSIGSDDEDDDEGLSNNHSRRSRARGPKEPPASRAFFCGVLGLASAYLTMVLSGWGGTDGSRIATSSPSAGWQPSGVGVMVAAQWCTIVLQFMILARAYIENGDL